MVIVIAPGLPSGEGPGLERMSQEAAVAESRLGRGDTDGTGQHCCPWCTKEPASSWLESRGGREALLEEQGPEGPGSHTQGRDTGCEKHCGLETMFVRSKPDEYSVFREEQVLQ